MRPPQTPSMKRQIKCCQEVRKAYLYLENKMQFISSSRFVVATTVIGPVAAGTFASKVSAATSAGMLPSMSALPNDAYTDLGGVFSPYSILFSIEVSFTIFRPLIQPLISFSRQACESAEF
jgi:hypothetical protein